MPPAITLSVRTSPWVQLAENRWLNMAKYDEARDDGTTLTLCVSFVGSITSQRFLEQDFVGQEREAILAYLAQR
jgi:hypothetical protein